MRIVEVGVETQVEEAARTIHHVGFQAYSMALTHIDRIGVRHHAAIEPMVLRHLYLVDFVGLATIVSRQTHRAKLGPILGPTSLDGIGIDTLQVRVTEAILVEMIQRETAQLLRIGGRDTVRVTQLEVMHRLGHIGQMQGRTHAEKVFLEVVLRRIGIDATHQFGTETYARLDGEAADLLLNGEKQLVVEVGEPGIIRTVDVVHPDPVGNRVGDQTAFLWVITRSQAHRNLAIVGIGAVVDDLTVHAHGTVFAVLTHHEVVFRGRGERPRKLASVAAAPTHAVDADGEVVALVVELMLVIQAAVGEIVAVPSRHIFDEVGHQGIGQELFAEHGGVVGVLTPVGPAADPNIQAVGRINLIIKAEVTSCAVALIAIARGVDFVVGQHPSPVKERLIGERLAFPDGIAAVDIGIDSQLLVRPNV